MCCYFLLLDAYARTPAPVLLHEKAVAILARFPRLATLDTADQHLIAGLLGRPDTTSPWPRATRLIEQFALPSEWIRWTLLDPLNILWDWGLRAKAENAQEEAALSIAKLFQAMGEWLMALPLSPIWRNLSADKLEDELRMLSATLFHEKRVRLSIGRRLLADLGADGGELLRRNGYLPSES